MAKPRMYFCVDIEADGPLVEIHPMRSIGIVAVDGETLAKRSEYHTNIAPHGTTDPGTMKWWGMWQKARAALDDPKPMDPQEAMLDLARWLQGFEDYRKIFVTDAPWFDWAWVRHYLIKHTGDQQFSGYFPYTWVANGARFSLPRVDNPHPHVSIWDAREIAEQFIALKKSTM